MGNDSLFSVITKALQDYLVRMYFIISPYLKPWSQILGLVPRFFGMTTKQQC